MFSIEHEFDASVITLVDEAGLPLNEDVVINVFAEQITLEQFNPRLERAEKITLSLDQVRDLAAALELPEGVYRIRPDQSSETGD